MSRYSDDRTLAPFAATVLRAAALVPPRDRHGGDLAFICDVWDTYPSPYLTRDRFDGLLAEAHREGLVWLRRADLVQEMPEGKVRRSRVEVDGAVFHFVCLP